MNSTPDVAVVGAELDRRATLSLGTTDGLSRAAAALGELIHPAAVLVVCGNWKYALAFFAASYAVVSAKDVVPVRFRGSYTAIGAVAVSVLLLIFRRTPFLIDASGSIPGLSGLLLGRRDLEFLGVSYCYLRVVYALASQRPWSFASFARYYFFFPTFISGPIVSPEEFRQSEPAGSHRRAEALSRILSGILRIAAASVLLTMIPLGSRSSIASCLAWPLPALWFGVFLSGAWLYLNFAGYSDLFIGLAALFGRKVPENFQNPFGAQSITAFWQRWHITLGNWLRTMIYNPLSRRAVLAGGSAVIPLVVVPIVTMIVCGLWHGFDAAFVIWGLLHGVGLAAHGLWMQFVRPRMAPHIVAHRAYGAVSWLLTHGFVALTWVFFLPVLPDVSLASRLRVVRALFGMVS